MEGAAAPLRVIFLDIDGVICCNSMGRLEDKKLRILQGVAQTAQAKIVLSTDWRRVPQLKTQLIGALRGLGMDVIGATPCRPNWQAVRPQEITSWLQAYHETAGTPERPYVSSYVAIDDRPLLSEQGGEQLRGHFVHTRVAVGITERAAERMVQLLTEPEPGAMPIPGLPAHLQPEPAAAAPAPPTSAVPERRALPPSTALLQHDGGYGAPLRPTTLTPAVRGTPPAARPGAVASACGKPGGPYAPANGFSRGGASAAGATPVTELAYGMANLGAPSLAGRGLPTLANPRGTATPAGRPLSMARRPPQQQAALRIGGTASTRVGGASAFGAVSPSRR